MSRSRMEGETALRTAALACLLLLFPVASGAQLVPGKHHFEPMAGVSFATSDLLATTTPMAFGFPPFSEQDHAEANNVATTIKLDPGAFGGLRYSYNVNQRLAVEGEFGVAMSVFVVEMLELFPPDDERAGAGEPQFETTTTDARIYHYSINLSYYYATWGVLNPFFTAGLGSRTLDLRQKGDVNTDSIQDRSYMAGLGVNFNVNERLRIRFDIRDYMYNFQFDNQFAGRNSDQLVAFRDVGRAVAVAGPRFQNDIVINVGFLVRAF